VDGRNYRLVAAKTLRPGQPRIRITIERMTFDDATAGRLPALDPSELEPERAALYGDITGGPRAADSDRSPITDERGRLLGPFNAMLFNPVLGAPMQALGAAIRYETSLSDFTRELAILVVAAALDSPFEWFAHERLARAAGVTEETIQAIAARRAPTDLNARHEAVLSSAQALAADGELSDAQFKELEAQLSTTGCVELVVLVGYYRMLALVLRAFRVPAPGSADPSSERA
jgi:4-carboxymuconolactone decarboxylase